MSIRFKFRSSVDFDSVGLGGLSSISVRDLRDRIVEQKNLKLCRDFDLVLSDADIGEEYEDDEFMIPEGSSVVIKRVPAVSGAAGDGGNSATKHLNMLVPFPSENVDVVNFDDFGNDLYPALGASLANSDDGADSPNQIDFNADVVPSCREAFNSRCQNFGRSDLSEALSEGNFDENCEVACNVDEIMNRTNQAYTAGNTLLNGKHDMCPPTMANTDLPMELKCSLCNTIFKEAVMIPCCQHSFCDKCIRSTLVEKLICPKCSSTKCGVNDLLPNLSLRQAIEHFPDSQIQMSGSDKILPKFVPDGESGIQGKDVSCAISICQRESPLPDSPTVTGKGSNQVMTESAYDSLIKKRGITAGTGSRIIRFDADKSAKPNPSGIKQERVRDEHNMPKVLKHMNDSQEGGPLKLSQNRHQKDEGTNILNKKKKGLFANSTEVAGSVMPSSRHRKGERNCYMCGSPDHLVRDCPAASSSYSMLPTGDAMFSGGMPAYGQYYWNRNPFHHVRPYAGLYGTSRMMPFDPTAVPVTPFAVPYYMPSIYSGLPSSWVGAVAPARLSGVECPPSHAKVLELQNRHLNEHFERGRQLDDDDSMEEYHYSNSRRRLHEHVSESDANSSRSNSSYESLRLRKKYSRVRNSQSPHRYRSDIQSDEELSSVEKHVEGPHCSASRKALRTHYSEKSNSEVRDVSHSFKYEYKERKKHRPRSSKKHSERGHGSDITRKSHHKNQKETSDDRGKAVGDHKRRSHKHHTHLDSSFDTDSNQRKQHHKEKESSHSPRHSKDMDRYSDDLIVDDRWEMIGSLHDSYGEDYHY